MNVYCELDCQEMTFYQQLIREYNPDVESFTDFVLRFETFVEIEKIPTECKAKCFLQFLNSRLREQLKDSLSLEYEKLKSLLQNQVHSMKTTSASTDHRCKLLNRKPRQGESMEDYWKELKILASYCEYDPVTCEMLVRDVYTAALLSSSFLNILSEDSSTNNSQPVNPKAMRSDKIKVSLPNSGLIVECVVKLQHNNEGSASYSFGALVVQSCDESASLITVNLSQITCVMNCSKPGQYDFAVHTADWTKVETCLKLHFLDRNDFDDWFDRLSNVCRLANGVSEIPHKHSLWSVSASGDVYVSDTERLKRNQATMNHRYCRTFDLRKNEKSFKIALLQGFTENTSITIKGQVSANAHRFFINLRCGNNDIAFHFNPRYDERQIVRNTFRNGVWGPEERQGSFIIERNANFALTILCLAREFKVFVNGAIYTYYSHRINPGTITDVEIGGNVIAHDVLYESNQVIMDLCELYWKKIPGSVQKIETCSAGVTWGITNDNVPVVYQSNNWQEINNEKLKNISLAVFDDTVNWIALWSVSIDGKVLYRRGVTVTCPSGEMWEHVKTSQPISFISVGGIRQVWCCSENGVCYRRLGITPSNPLGEEWQTVQSTTGLSFETIAIGKWAVWGLDTVGNLYSSAMTAGIPEKIVWKKVENYGLVKFKHITANGEHLWTVTKDGVICKRIGTIENNPEGVSWIYGLSGGCVYLSA